MAGVTLLGRPLLGACLFLSWMASVFNIAGRGRPIYTRGAGLALGVPLGAKSWLLAAGTLACAAACWMFSVRWHQGLAGLACLALIARIRAAERRQWPEGEVGRLGQYFPAAACLAAYTLVYLASTGSSPSYRELAGWEAACGTFAAMYPLSALTKWRAAGWSWFGRENMGLLLAERAYGSWPPLASLRLFVARMPGLCRALAVCGLAIEISAASFVAAAARAPFAAAAAAFQLAIAVLLGYVEPEWALLPVALAAGSTQVRG